jgi:hypothetical protein
VRERVTMRGTVAFDSTTTGETLPSIVWISCVQARRRRVASPHGCGAPVHVPSARMIIMILVKTVFFGLLFAEVVVIPPEYSTQKYAENTPKRPSSLPSGYPPAMDGAMERLLWRPTQNRKGGPPGEHLKLYVVLKDAPRLRHVRIPRGRASSENDRRCFEG